jgi:glycosyltransferase involved in cell wall biosynthesis
MNIQIVNSLYTPNHHGGAEISVQLISEDLVKSGHEVSVISIGERNSSSTINGVKIYYLKTKNIYSFLSSEKHSLISKFIWHFFDIFNLFHFFTLYKIIKNIKPDVIWTNNLAGFSVIIWFIAKIVHVPVVHTIRDYYLLCPSATMYRKGRKCPKQCFRCRILSLPKKLMSNYVDSVVGISHHVLKKHLDFGYFKNSIFKKVVYNSIAEVNKRGEEETIEFILDDKKIRFGFLGSITQSKGIEYLLREFNVFLSQRRDEPDVQLIVAGKGDYLYESYLKEEYASPNILFLGKVDPKSFFLNIDYLVVPSLWEEPFGRVVVEAYQNHRLVLAANNGGLSEFAKFGNIELFNVEEGSLTRLFKQYSTDRPQFNFQIWNKYKKLFCSHSIAHEYLNIFKSVC